MGPKELGFAIFNIMGRGPICIANILKLGPKAPLLDKITPGGATLASGAPTCVFYRKRPGLRDIRVLRSSTLILFVCAHPQIVGGCTPS